MPRILVTAALGNVGRAVVRECLARGLAVRATDRSEAKVREALAGLTSAAPSNRLAQPHDSAAPHVEGAATAVESAGADAESARFDFLDRATWAPALRGCERVFLLRPPPVGDMDATLLPFIDEAYAAGVEHIVFLSVARADEMKWVPHRKVELHLLASGKAWTVLRPGFFAQNLEDAYRADIVEDDRIYVPAGKGRVAFIDAADIGAVAACVLAEPAPHRAQFLTLTGPAAITFDEVVALLSAELGRTIRYDAASILGYAWHLRHARGLTVTQLTIQTILHVGLRGGDAERVEPTVARLLGRSPRTMGEYIHDAAAQWRR